MFVCLRRIAVEKLLITGGKPLKGTVAISGAKNAVVAIIPATLLVKGVCRIENVPDISDVDIIVKMISSLGAKVQREGSNTLIIDSSDLKTYVADPVLASKMRASYYLMGALIGRFGNAHVPPPGGCNFGSRPIDQHIKAFKHLNCLVAEDDVFVKIDASSLKGGNIFRHGFRRCDHKCNSCGGNGTGKDRTRKRCKRTSCS